MTRNLHPSMPDITTIDDQFNQQQYTQNTQAYISHNHDGNVGGNTPESRVSLFSQYLPANRHVFEIGSGSGIDALALQNHGYQVTASDFVDSFLAICKEKGLHTLRFNAKTDQLPSLVDAIYSNAVFVHFTPAELKDFLLRTQPHLANEKLIFFTVIKGQGSERSARAKGFERDFHYYTLPELQTILSDSNFKILHSQEISDKWIQIIAQSF